MITAPQAAKLLALIAEYKDAAVAESWAGGADPVVAKELRADLTQARIDLCDYLAEISNTPTLSDEEIIDLARAVGIAATDYVDMYSAHKGNLIDFAHAVRKEGS